MSIQKQTPAQVASAMLRLTGGKLSLEAVAQGYIDGAREMHGYAVKAAASKSGKYRGYTESHALSLAKDQAERAVSVPAELEKLMAC